MFNQPVSGAELDAWLAEVLPAAEGQVFHTNYGTLAADEEREETTANLPEGSYSLTLACRSPRRVSFSVGHADTELVDLNLRCGTSRVNVVSLPAGRRAHHQGGSQSGRQLRLPREPDLKFHAAVRGSPWRTAAGFERGGARAAAERAARIRPRSRPGSGASPGWRRSPGSRA